MQSCAIDISDQSIKYGELKIGIHGLRLGCYGQSKIPEGIIEFGKIKDEKRLIDILKTLRIKEDLFFVRVSLPEEQMYLFNFSLPKIDGIDLKEAILLQLEEYIPIKAEDAFFDYDILSQTESTVLLQVVAIAKEVIENYVSVFKEAGLVPVSFELESQAIARAVIKENDDSSIMIIDFGHIHTGISIVSCGRVLFTSTINMGSSMLTDTIAKNFSISFEEAEKMKCSYIINSLDIPSEVFSVILSGLSVLRDEINKYLLFWATHNDEIKQKHIPVTKIILCGGGSNVSGLADYLSASIKIKVEYANTWINISDLKKEIPKIPYQESLFYSTVLGLALGDYI